MRTIGLALALLVGALLSGCSSAGDGDGTPTSSPTGSPTGTTSPTASPTVAPTVPPTPGPTPPPPPGGRNEAPVASLEADFEGLDVNFTVAATDPDGDALEWTLDFGDGTPEATGSQLPASIGHVYAAAGTYNATLTVTDGALDDEAVLEVALTGTGAGETFTVSWPAAAPSVCTTGIYFPALDGVTQVSRDIDPATIGLAYTITYSATQAAATGWGHMFVDAGGSAVEDPSTATANPHTGIVPADAATVTIYACDGADFDAVYVAGTP